MKLNPKETLVKLASLQRSVKALKLLDHQLDEQSRQQFSATLISFDAASGLYTCRLEDGTIVQARSIASSGSKGVGAIVALYKPQVGLPIIKWL